MFVGILVIAYGIYYYVLRNPKVTLEFEEGSMVLDNPGRGFYVQIDSREEERISGMEEAGVGLILLAYDLHDYIDCPLDENKLQELKDFLEEIKEYKMKVIFRAAYRFGANYDDPDSIERITEHIGQISGILNAYADQILCVQAGFLGPWGEWHSSGFLENSEEENTQVRNTILKSLLEKLNKEIIINVRRPRFIRDAQAAGLDISRIGFHNDALLSTEDDMGTYDEKGYTRKDELEWVKQNIETGINGGEMTQISDFTEIKNAVKEFQHLHLTYLNLMYNQEVLESWKTQSVEGQNGYDYMNNHLGYRYSIKNMKLPTELKAGHMLRIKGEIINTGFAPISNEYKFYFVIKKDQDIYYNEIMMSSLDQQILNFNLKVTIPKEIKALQEGEALEMGILLTDRLSEDYRVFSIRFANEEIIYKNGINLFAVYHYNKKRLTLKQSE